MAPLTRAQRDMNINNVGMCTLRDPPPNGARLIFVQCHDLHDLSIGDQPCDRRLPSCACSPNLREDTRWNAHA